MTLIIIIENAKSQESGTTNTLVHINVINLVQSKYKEQNKISVKINRDINGHVGTPKKDSPKEKRCKNLH